MTGIHYVVGAYASLPKTREEQAGYYSMLGEQNWIEGTEIPYPGDMKDPDTRAWLAEQLPRNWHHNTMTLIPGTMQNIGKDPTFGLASPDEEGRLKAIKFVLEAHEALARFAELRGSNDITHMEIHTAPTALASADAMHRSLTELMTWAWYGTQLVIEHCDKHIEGQPPEKGFLSIEEEIELCKDHNIGLTVNWGRSCVEGRNTQLPAQHLQKAQEAGVLHGLMFSGAGPEQSQYGYPWIDGHLPMSTDEPTSWMTPEHVSTCTRIARTSPDLAYLGAKVCVPQDASPDERLMHLNHIHDADAIAGGLQ